MIKYKGFGVAPAELESLLQEHPAVLDAGVVGVPDEEACELIKAYVVLRAESDSELDAILHFANQRLAGYKQVHCIERIDAIPKNASGKILRRELRAKVKAE